MLSIATNDLQGAQAFSVFDSSPLLLYTALASQDLPVPWLVVAVDSSAGRGRLVAGRDIVDQLGSEVTALPDTPAALVHGTSWRSTFPIDSMFSYYCQDPEGRQRWLEDFCPWNATNYDAGGVYRYCQAELSSDFTHTATTWYGTLKKRRRSEAFGMSCSDPVLITHQYKNSYGNWVNVAPAQVEYSAGNVKSTWGIGSNRPRRVRYQRFVQDFSTGGGGVRAYTLFKRYKW